MTSPPPRPLVLIGAGRSGTRFLRDLLACHPAVECLPFDLNHVWRLGNEQTPDDCLNADTLTAPDLNRIRQILMRLARPGPDCRVLVEKTVSNGLRVPLVQAVLPDAVFVHLVRDGRAVVESAQRCWQTPPERAYLLQILRYLPRECLPYAVRYGLTQLGARISGDARSRRWGPRTPWTIANPQASLTELCAWQWRECVMNALSGFGTLNEPPITVRYEDLCVSPQPLLQILERMGLDDPGDQVAQQWQQRHQSNRNTLWEGAWNGQERALIEDIIEPAQHALGYGLTDALPEPDPQPDQVTV